jgi:hypothetical protein
MIRSASRLLFSRSLSASASSSASDGNVLEGRLGLALTLVLTNAPTLCAKLAANWETEEEGDGDRCHPCSSSESSTSWSIPVEVKPFLKGEGGLLFCAL